MKKINRILTVAFALTILISLTGCIVIPLYKYYDDIDTEKVSSVDIYDLRNSESYYSDFLETETPVYTLKDDQLNEFWGDLGKIRFTDQIIITIAAVDPSFSYDEWVVRINYIDGSYSLISCDGYGETYDKNNQVIDTNHFGCDNEEWKQFIGKYLPKELFEGEI